MEDRIVESCWMQYKYISSKQLQFADLTICLLFVVVPLLIQLPYRVNIFLSWEGAYRLYLGQMPYRDFGMPLGFGYWLLPAFFFKLFGPSFSALIKSQVLLNTISILSVRGILRNLKVDSVSVTLTLLVFCLTYVIYNFWPWYNHSVVVYELASIYFLTKFFSSASSKFGILHLSASALCAFLSFFTKQDVGALCFVLCIFLLIYRWRLTGNLRDVVFFVVCYFTIALVFIIPFLKYDFLYFFNYGQAPHNSRLGFAELVNVFLNGAVGEKFYLFLFAIIFIVEGKTGDPQYFITPERVALTSISVFMILQAVVTRATSPLPTDHMSYYHAFGFILLSSYIDLGSRIQRVRTFVPTVLLLCVCFSPGYWGYASNLFGFSKPKKNESTTFGRSPWVAACTKGFDRVLVPQETKKGIARLLSSPISKRTDLKVLNMSELTPLAQSLHYVPLTNQPLWYHLNIGMFQKEVNLFCERIKKGEYDLVLFEEIPDLTEFYPYQVRDTLRKYYCLQDRFLAPRKLENSTIEVYVKPDKGSGLASQ